LCVILNNKDKPASGYDIIAAGLFFVMAAVTHALTALFGGLFLGVLGVAALIFCEKTRKLWLLAYFSMTAFFSLLVLSPWMYLLSQFKNKVAISQSSYLNSVDTNILSMLCPFPFDFRSIHKGVQDVSTPYLDAQVVLPLGILIAVFIYIRLRDKSVRFRLGACPWALIGASVGMLMIALVLLVDPAASVRWGGFFNILQYAYRLTSYVNLSILVVVIILAGRMNRANVRSQQVINVCLAFCIAISFSALMLKLVQASAIIHKSTKVDGAAWAPLPFGSGRHLIELPGSFASATDYTVVDGLAKDTVSGMVPVIPRYFNVLDGARFGQVEPLTVNLGQPTLVLLNIQPFPWNRISINGAVQLPSNLISDGRQEAVLLPAGSYLFKAVTHIDGMWKFLNILSWVLLLGAMALYLAHLTVKLWGRVHA